MKLNDTSLIHVGGEIEYEVRDEFNNVVHQSERPFHNELLDSFWTRLNTYGVSNSTFHCKVGSSAATTVPTMTTVQTPIALTSGQFPNMSTSTARSSIYEWNHLLSIRKTNYSFVFTYAVGQLNGTVREIGFDLNTGSSQSNGTGYGISTRVVGFPDIPINTSQQLIVRYNFYVYAKAGKTVQVFPANIYGTATPITVTMLRRFGSDEIFDTSPIPHAGSYYSFGYLNSDNGVTAVNHIRDTTTVAAGLYPSNSPMIPVGYKTASQVMFSIARANFATGIRSIQTTDALFIAQFDPAIPKDADSEFRFSVATKISKMSSGEATAAMTPLDTTIPVIDFQVNPTTFVLEDLAGTFTLRDERQYLSGVMHGLPAVTMAWHKLPTEKNSLIRLISDRYFALGTTYSIEFVTLHGQIASHLAHFYGVGNADLDAYLLSSLSTFTTSRPSGNRFSHSGDDNYTEVSPTGQPAGEWVKVTIHKSTPTPTSRRLEIYVNGVLAGTNNTASSASNQAMMSNISTAVLLARDPTIVTRHGAATYLNSFKLYNNYLVPPSATLPTFTPPPLPRTMLLLDFATGLPQNTNSQAYNFGAAVYNPNGGKDNLPYIRATNQHLQISDFNLQAKHTDEFTIELDIRIVTSPSTTVYMFSWPTRTGSPSASGVTMSSSRSLSITSTGGSVTGTTTLGANVWETLTIVRRLEGANYVTYFFKDGVVGLKLTTASNTDRSAYLFVGNLLMFGEAGGTNDSQGIVYDLANVRITRGVIEHFNPAGFTQPTGARGVIN